MADVKKRSNRKITLTDRVLKSLRLNPEKQIDYFDKDFDGSFSVRVSSSGTKSFCLFYRRGRQLRRFTIGRYPAWSLADARDRARDALTEIRKGDDPAANKKADREALTFGELGEMYLKKYAIGPDPEQPKKKSWREDKRILSVYLSKFKNVSAKDVSKADVRATLEEIAVEAPVMANRVLACWRKIFNFGIGSDIVESNPCFKIEQPGKETSRDRCLSEEEIRKLWKALESQPGAVSDSYQLRLLTAQRSGEILTMRWQDIDLQSRWWTIPAESSKNKLPHRVWLSDSVMRIIQRRKKAAKDSPWVFPGRRKGQPLVETKRGKKTIADAAGIAQWTGHDLRRTAASFMASIGVPRFVIGRVLNHSETSITGVYDRYGYDREKQEALKKWATRLTMIITNIKEVKREA